MSQEINLYQPMFRREKVVFSSTTLIALVIGFGLLFLLWGILSGQRVDQLADELDRRLGTERQIAARLTELRSALDARSPSRVLEDRLEAAEARRARLEASRIALIEQVPERPLRLVDVLETLGRRHPDGLWLTAIELTDSGRRLSLEGRALIADRLPVFIEALRGAEALEGLSLREIAVESSSEAEDGIRFRATAQRSRP